MAKSLNLLPVSLCVMISLSQSNLPAFAGETEMCENPVLVQSKVGQSIEYRFKDFPNLRIVPVGGCGSDDACVYNVFLKGERNSSAIKSNWSVGPICDSVSLSIEEGRSNQFEYGDSSAFAQFEFVEIKNFRLSSGDEWVNAQVFRYYSEDPDALRGIWGGDTGGGEVWIHEAFLFQIYAQ